MSKRKRMGNDEVECPCGVQISMRVFEQLPLNTNKRCPGCKKVFTWGVSDALPSDALVSSFFEELPDVLFRHLVCILEKQTDLMAMRCFLNLLLFPERYRASPQKNFMLSVDQATTLLRNTGFCATFGENFVHMVTAACIAPWQLPSQNAASCMCYNFKVSANASTNVLRVFFGRYALFQYNPKSPVSFCHQSNALVHTFPYTPRVSE